MQNGTLGSRMRAARLRVRPKLSLREVGQRIAAAINRPEGPYSAQAVQQWEKDETEPDIPTLIAFAQLVGANLEHLLTGLQVLPLEGGGAFGTFPDRGRVVPMITIDQATDTPIDYRSDELMHTRSPCSKKAFLIRVFDRRNSPEFEPGDLVLLDPAKKPDPGEMALARVNGRPVFGKFVRRGRGKTTGVAIDPLNPDWDRVELGKSDRIIACMLDHTKPGSRPRTK